MKSTAELISGTAHREQGRVRAAARAGIREGELKAADEIGELLTTEAQRLMEAGEEPGIFWGIIEAWYKATRETTAGE